VLSRGAHEVWVSQAVKTAETVKPDIVLMVAAKRKLLVRALRDAGCTVRGVRIRPEESVGLRQGLACTLKKHCGADSCANRTCRARPAVSFGQTCWWRVQVCVLSQCKQRLLR
jgi:hypothetical protein